MKRSRILSLTLLAAAILSGCSGGRDAFKDQNRQLELNGPVYGSVVSSQTAGEWSLESFRRISVTACLVEGAMLRPVGAGEWYVDGTGIETTATSDDRGCVTWEEQVAFEPSARPIYIPLTRQIRPRDGRYNAVQVKFAVNPWSGMNGAERAVADPTTSELRHMAAEDAVSASLAGLNRAGRLSVTHVDHALKMQPSPTLSLRFHPEIKTLDMAGAEQLIALERGRVEVRARLAYRETPTSALVPLHREIVVSDHSFQNGVINLRDLAIKDLRTIEKTRGTYHLLLRVRPLKGPAGLEAFEGVLLLGDWVNLRGGSSSNTEEEELKTVEVAPMETRPAGPGFHVGFIRGATYGPLDENTVYRRIQLTMGAPVYGTALGESLEDETFLITSVDDPQMIFEKRVRNGALDWQDAVVHNMYAPMTERLERDIWITRVKTGEKIKKTLFLTPGVRFLIVIMDADGANLPEEEVRKPIADTTDQNASLRLEFPCMTAGDPTYNVDPNSLDLHVRFITNFQFTPTVRRFDEPFWGMNTYDGPGLRAGYFLLTVAVFNLDRPNFAEPIAISQRIVLHLGGNLATQVSLLTRDVSMSRTRNYAVAQLHFLDPETLRDAKGVKVDPFKAFRDGLPISQGEVMKNLTVNIPLNVFPLVLSNESCAANVSVENEQNPELQAVTKKLVEAKIDLLELARKKPEVVRPDPLNWKYAAENWGLRPLVLSKPADARRLGYSNDVAIEEIEEALECAYAAGESSDRYPAKCLFDNRHPFQELCRAVAVNWFDKLDRMQTAKKGESRMRREYLISTSFLHNCTKETSKYFRVRKYTQVTELEKTDDLRVRGAIPVGVGLRKSFFIGTDRGTEFMHESLARLSGRVSGGTSMEKIMEGFTKIFAAKPSGAVMKDAVDPLESMGFPSSSVKISLSKNLDSFRWTFNYQIPYTMAGLSSTTSLSLESRHVELDVLRSRTCFTLEAIVNDDQWESLFLDVPQSEAPAPRYFVCFPEKREKRTISERYYFVYNGADGQGAMIDNDRASNRWMLSFRGERDFTVFMSNIRPHVDVLFRDDRRAMEPVNSFVDNLRESPLMDKTAYPGLVSGPVPGDDRFDSIYNLEGWFPKFWRWLVNETPFSNQGAPTIRDQNSPDSRQFFEYH